MNRKDPADLILIQAREEEQIGKRVKTGEEFQQLTLFDYMTLVFRI